MQGGGPHFSRLEKEAKKQKHHNLWPAELYLSVQFTGISAWAWANQQAPNPEIEQA